MTSLFVDADFGLCNSTSVKLTDQASGWHFAQNTLKGRKWRNYAEVKKDHESEREKSRDGGT